MRKFLFDSLELFIVEQECHLTRSKRVGYPLNVEIHVILRDSFVQ